MRSAKPPSALYRPVFQVFSSFTSIASCLALAVELQHGGRVPFLAGKQELCGCIFLLLVGKLVSLPDRSLPRRAVTCLALSGVLVRRLAARAAIMSLALSPSFLAASFLFGWAVKKLVLPDRPLSGAKAVA